MPSIFYHVLFCVPLLINPTDGNLHKLLLKYTELDSQYEGLSDNLKRMNGTISYLMNSVTYMQNHFDDRITWISQLLDGAGKYLLLLFFSVKKSGGDLVSMIFICMIYLRNLHEFFCLLQKPPIFQNFGGVWLQNSVNGL